VGAGSKVPVPVVELGWTEGVDRLGDGDGVAGPPAAPPPPPDADAPGLGEVEVEALGLAEAEAEVEAEADAEREALGLGDADAEREALGRGLAFEPPGPVPVQAARNSATGKSTTKPTAVRMGANVPDIDSPLRYRLRRVVDRYPQSQFSTPPADAPLWIRSDFGWPSGRAVVDSPHGRYRADDQGEGMRAAVTSIEDRYSVCSKGMTLGSQNSQPRDPGACRRR
jgi:hypothetical protein